MALQIVSDLHLESPKAYDVFEIVPKAPYLALLGDIGTFSDSHKNDFLSFLRRQLQNFRIVFFVAGNHESYGTTWPKAQAILYELEQESSNNDSLGEFVFMNRRVYEIPDSGVTLLGCSLFSFVPSESAMAVEMRMNDFYSTHDWDVAQHNAAHAQDLEWLNDQVASETTANNTIMILTHWSPTTDPRSLDPKHLGKDNPIGCAFSTDLSGQKCFESEKVRVWAFGHTHYNCNFEIERGERAPLKVITNQRGYYFSQAAGFDEEKVVDFV
ncbi:hypothetical protein KC343_g7685 [Hortaea werneckii]|uniref:Calcineurin-like phosphoesterase domain-containing protein n=1 Tax=Hortaea werneckii TaxID=91943 RepID=A0A3M7GLZ6_HORWE|nr:hypothetical protein KC338_g8011 [Hortaea werneckii]KAI7566310.1 hypothetical protein KC317_g5757 [Hortaea werneckii]KAI7617609.1 hypothetical protein KC346_g5386 [Hortaea werneckii]KAI7622321.1 hypothetical protein KC343_g7685 [Hortaea werneckii]KAI7672088.1 hypothetical protein KC319_g5416 [Hortaea werneckii]